MKDNSSLLLAKADGKPVVNKNSSGIVRTGSGKPKLDYMNIAAFDETIAKVRPNNGD